MKEERKKFNTPEDMLSYAVSRPTSQTKWRLKSDTSREYDDPQAGEAWEEKRPDMSYDDLRKLSSVMRGLFYDQQADYEKTKPPTHIVITWTLAQVSSGWHSEYIDLSPELGEMLDKVWTKVPRWKGSQDLKNDPHGLTVGGMLKRLGRTDAAGLVKAARKAEEEQRAKNVRNSHRREVAEAAQKLLKEIEQAERHGVDVPVAPSDMAKLDKQLEE